MKVQTGSDRRLRIMARHTRGRILDVGCHNLLNRYLRGPEIVGLDLQPTAPAPPYTAMLQGDITMLARQPVKPRYDTVVMGEVLEHIETPHALLRDLRAHVLVPGGRLVLSTPNPIGFPKIIAEYLGGQRFCTCGEHVFELTPRWVVRMLRQCGYEKVRTFGAGLSLVWGTVPAPAALSYCVVYVADAVATP